jgi:threonine dehydrogenase-like Zn-dependent dehydrogenase
VVVGDGPMALLNSMILRLSGFESVRMIHGDSGKGDWAVHNGYFDQGDVISERGDVVGNVIERMGGELADVVIICTPGEAVEQAARDALAYLRSVGLINFVSDAVPPVISLGTGDLKVHELQLRNHCGLAITGHVEGFESENRRIVRVTGQHGISSAHIQASVTLLIENPQPFDTLVTDVVNFDDAHLFISSAVEWSLGRGFGDRPMKTVIEINRT